MTVDLWSPSGGESRALKPGIQLDHQDVKGYRNYIKSFLVCLGWKVLIKGISFFGKWVLARESYF